MTAGARILLFAKAPEPGLVKTRLAGVLGAEGAARLYKDMALRCIANACGALPGAVELWCSPDATHPFFRECAAQWGVALREQGRGDLGNRMSEALQEVMRTSAVVLLMGTDVPSITANDINAAAVALRSGKDAVFVPTEDGGYGLIGLRRHDVRLFGSIDWSTGAVMEQTRRRLKEMAWDWSELPSRWDVDAPEDLSRLAGLPGFGALAHTPAA